MATFASRFEPGYVCVLGEKCHPGEACLFTVFGGTKSVAIVELYARLDAKGPIVACSDTVAAHTGVDSCIGVIDLLDSHKYFSE